MQNTLTRTFTSDRSSVASTVSVNDNDKLKKVLCVIISVLSLIGFVLQAWQISVKFFEREVTSKLEITKSDIVHPPALAVCARLGDIDYQDGDFTGQELLDAVPEVADIFDGCTVRLPDSYLITSLNSSAECLEYITVLKYTRHRKICYRFSLKSPYLVQTYHHSAESPVIKGLLYKINLVNQIFTESYLFDIEFTSPGLNGDRFPSRTFAVGSRLYTGVATGQRPKTSFLTSYGLFTNHMLMAPYKSNCITYAERNDGVTSKDSCLEKCKSLATRERLQKVPFTTYVSQHMTDWLTIDILSAADLRNETLRRMFNDIEETCLRDSRCQYNNCYDETIVSHSLANHQTDEVEFEVHTSKDPHYESFMVPRLEFMDYAIYLASALGLWFGVTVLDTKKLAFSIRNRIVRGSYARRST
ncbi:hypothetical protein HDE_03881 [Halotydeus destructor]|nr:hypothetical protein HDE_03881 [Halotydeus destructor]